MTRTELAFAALLMCCLAPVGAGHAGAMPSPLQTGPAGITGQSTFGLTTLAQTQPAQAPAATPSPSTAPDHAADEEPIGNVATLTGSATVTRNNAAAPLKLQDDIFQGDILQTSANSALGVTFSDATTFNLTVDARIEVDSFVYADGGKQNGALFNIARGTVAFAAAAVAKTGDMKISTPSATLGIRGTTGLIEVPEGAGNANNVAIKLYPDADGKVGRIEVNGRDGSRLGFLTQGSSGFTIRPGAGGRFAAVPLMISPQQALRDQGFVRQLHATQSIGRRIVTEKRIQRLQNPGQQNPNRNNPPRNNQPANPALRPGLQKQNSQRPGSPRELIVPNRAGQPPLPPPGLQNRPAFQPRRPALPGAPKGKPKREKH